MTIKATGVVRKVDPLGRVVLPVELRRTLGINEKDPLEIFVNSNGQIILEKYSPGCVICGGMENVFQVNGKGVCSHCRTDITVYTPKIG